MPKLDGTGPEGEGRQTGRKLGYCSENQPNEQLQKLGVGMGKRRKSGGGKGKAKRLQSAKEFILSKFKKRR